MLFLGDVMLGRLVDQIFPVHVNAPEDEGHARMLFNYRGNPEFHRAGRMPHRYVWDELIDDFQAVDVRIINLETSVTTHPKKWPDKAFNYRMHPENLKCLTEAQIDYVSLANNHTLDFEVQGMYDTMKALDEHGIRWAGVGRNLEEAMKPAVFTVKGTTLAAYSFSDHYDFWAAGPNKPGINFLDVDAYTTQDIARIKAHMDDTRRKTNVDIMLVSLHWGPNYSWSPSEEKQQFAKDLIDHCGVDIIHGHSAHHIQGIELYKGKPILYGCGDFVDDYAVTEQFRNDLGFAYFINWDKSSKSAKSIDLIPTKIELFQATKTMAPGEKRWMASTMTRLCSKFGTKLEVRNDGTFHIPC